MTNKEQLKKLLENLKHVSGRNTLCHVDLNGVRVYIDKDDYLDKDDVNEWYFHITYEGLIAGYHVNEITEFIDLTKWFDAINEKIEPLLEKCQQTIDVDVITVNGVQYKRI